MLISETKLDDTCPKAQFNIGGFCTPCRYGCCVNEGDIPLYIRDDIPSRLRTDYKVQDGDKCFFAEMNWKKMATMSLLQSL